MHLIVCIDSRDGLHFAGRRVSSDRVVTECILRQASDTVLWIHPGSGSLFSGENVIADPRYLEKAQAGDCCFLEKDAHLVPSDRLESVTLYQWNRSYPFTERFPRELLRGMRLADTREFPGHSHEKITVERYIP